jgi:WD40 repeat protein
MDSFPAILRKYALCARFFFPALLALGLHCPSAAGQNAMSVAVDSDTVLTVAYSPDGRVLAGGGFAKAVFLWDARTGKLLHSLEGPRRTTRRSITFSPDGKTLAGCGDDGVIHLWNVRTGALERSLPALAGVQHTQSIAISPDGTKLAVASSKPPDKDGRSPSEVTVLDLKTGKAYWTRAQTEGRWVYSVTFAPNGGTLAVADGTVHLLDAGTGAPVKSLQVEDRVAMRIAFSPDGKSLAGAGGHWVKVGGGTQQISAVFLWDVQTGKLLRTLTDLQPWLRSVAFSPDGKTLATGSSGPILQKGSLSWVSSEIRLWDPQSGRLLRSIQGELAEVSSVAFSPDGKSLLSCDGEVVALTETLTGLRRLTLMKRTLKPFSTK